MRISDWSSDVCSSDLVGCSNLLQELFPGVVGDVEFVDAIDAAAPSFMEGLLARRSPRGRRRGSQSRDRCGPHAVSPTVRFRGALDRKSGVSGKGVAVRVDLGGRRPIQKKKTYK